MRLGYAHFPISAVISKDKKQIEIRNFLGGKKPHTINLNPGCTVYQEKDVKDTLVFDGIDNAALSQSSQSCARVRQDKSARSEERRMRESSWTVSSCPRRPSPTQLRKTEQSLPLNGRHEQCLFELISH